MLAKSNTIRHITELANTKNEGGTKMRKQKSYKTATALIACSAFSAGDTVSVHYYYTDETGMDWYDCYVTPGIDNEVMYPAKHLTNFAF